MSSRRKNVVSIAIMILIRRLLDHVILRNPMIASCGRPRPSVPLGGRQYWPVEQQLVFSDGAGGSVRGQGKSKRWAAKSIRG